MGTRARYVTCQGWPDRALIVSRGLSKHDRKPAERRFLVRHRRACGSGARGAAARGGARRAPHGSRRSTRAERIVVPDPTARGSSRRAPGPLHGVPFTVKEAIDDRRAAGARGIAAAGARVAPDAPGWHGYERPGRSRSARRTLRALRAPRLDQPRLRRNPEPARPSRSAGGSSGGEAAAVARGCRRSGSAPTTAARSARRPTSAGLPAMRPGSAGSPTAGHMPRVQPPFRRMVDDRVARPVGGRS